MRKFTLLGMAGLCLLLSVAIAFSQGARKQVTVPKVSPSEITIDGKMDEAAWNNAAHADMVTPTGFEIYANNYGRASLIEPDYQEMYGRMLWAQDTLYVFMHIKEIVNDSSGLFWDPSNHWASDQLLISLSSRLGLDLDSRYAGNVYKAPEGPYNFLVLGNRVTLNDSALTAIPPEWRKFPADTERVFNANDICRYATFIDTTNGIWNVEMAIYNPNINAGTNIAFNIGGSQSSRYSATNSGDSYFYYTWQPSVVDSPMAVPPTGPGAPGDPGGFSLINSQYWALLNFAPGVGDNVRKLVNVPRVNPADVHIDGKMNESFWNNAAHADMVTPTGFEIYANNYGRASLIEPDYQEMYGRMLWAQDTLYVFMHIKEIVNDSSGLYWDPSNHWASDQLLISLSSRLGLDLDSRYAGNVYKAPEGPYNYLVLGNRVTLNDSALTGIPPEWRKFPADTERVFNANEFCRYATFIDTTNGIWDVEMAIYQPNVGAESKVGFNIGGSQSSRYSATNSGDSYFYYTWQPSVVDSPMAVPPTGPGAPGDPGGFSLINSQYWALLRMDTTAVVTSVREANGHFGVPAVYTLSQNYPNPFNPTTNIQFSIPTAAKVTMKVYNILGQVVTELVNGQYMPGRYEVTWNANRMASGMYFYQLSVDNRVVETKRMMLLK